MGLMDIEVAKALQRERMADAERRQRRREWQRRAREQEVAAAEKKHISSPKVDWPVFSIRIGGFELVAFRTVRLGA